VNGNPFYRGEFKPENTSFRGQSLQNETFQYWDFKFIDFVDSEVRNCDFSFSNFSYTNLSSARFVNCNFSHVDLTGAIVETLILENCNLDGITSQKLEGEPRLLPSRWLLHNGYLVGPGADLSGADLSLIDLSDLDLSGFYLAHSRLYRAKSRNTFGSPELPACWSLRSGYLVGPGADLEGQDLSNLGFQDLDLSYASISFAKVENTNFANSTFEGIKSEHVVGAPSELPRGWIFREGRLIGPNVILGKANLTGTDLSGADLTGVDLSRCNLTQVKSGRIIRAPSALPSGWVFHQGYLIGPDANLSEADFSGKRFKGTNLSGATLVKSKLENAEFLRVNISQTDLRDANLTGLRTEDLVGEAKCLPDGWKKFKQYLVGPSANLSGADLTYVDFEDISLFDTNFYGTRLAGAKLDRANLTKVRSGRISGRPTSLPHSWSLVGGYLIGPHANLRQAKLDSLDLSGVNLSGVDLEYANLKGIRSGGIEGEPSNLPAEFALVSGYIVGPGVNLQDAIFEDIEFQEFKLRETNLSKSRFTNCTFIDVDFSDSNLESVNFLDCNFMGVIFTNTRLDKSYLENCSFSACDLSFTSFAGTKSQNVKMKDCILPPEHVVTHGMILGRGVNLSNLDLTALDFSHLDLSAADFSGACVCRANFTGANLVGSSFADCCAEETIFNHAKLRDIDFSGADLSLSRFDASRLKVPIRGKPVALPYNCRYSARSNWLVIYPFGTSELDSD
jgi:uncharacterized protein YjbI with pentapeptide repeats